MKRFYKDVAIGAVDDDGHADTDADMTGADMAGTTTLGVFLDGRQVRTPAKKRLWVPSAPLAEAIAAEWAAQGERVELAAMALTRLAAAAVDRVVPRREGVVAELVAYGRTDLVCYRAEAPAALVQRQAETWQPLVDWAARRYGAALVVAGGVMPVAQPPPAVAALERALGAYGDHQLAALSLAAGAAGSLVIALALAEGRLAADEALAAAALDELYQAERWGEEETATRRRVALADDLALAARYLALLDRA